MRASVALLTGLILSVCLCSEAAQPRTKLLRVFWPKLTLAKDSGERIEAIEIVVSCGRFRGVSNIPNAWSLEVLSPSSEQTSLRASAGHGATMLWDMRELDGVVSVAVVEPSCFDISAQITTDRSGENKQYHFKRSDLRLRP
jgi:hypothetical protein